MKKFKFSCQLMSLLISAVLFSCSSDSDPEPEPTTQKSSAKSITSFKISSLSPEVTGTISESEKKITATVPNGTNVTALIPTIAVSEKSTVSPASSVAQNFTNSVNYTVTAEDGSTQVYQVTVIIDATVNFTVNSPSTTEIQQDGVLILNGTNFGSAENNKIVLINKADNSKTYEYPVAMASSDQALFIKVAADLPIGEYFVKVYIGQQSKQLGETFNVVYHSPEVTGWEGITVVRGEKFSFTGKYFQATGNQVRLKKGNSTINLQIISESSTSIEVRVPASTDPDEYTLSVTSNGKTSHYTFVTVTLSPTAPVITSVNKTTIKKGETLIIYGSNLKKPLTATNINFVPFPNGGTTQLRSGIANAEGTEVSYTLPDSFPTGTYTIFVEVDFEFSDEYNEVILITE